MVRAPPAREYYYTDRVRVMADYFDAICCSIFYYEPGNTLVVLCFRFVNKWCTPRTSQFVPFRSFERRQSVFVPRIINFLHPPRFFPLFVFVPGTGLICDNYYTNNWNFICIPPIHTKSRGMKYLSRAGYK